MYGAGVTSPAVCRARNALRTSACARVDATDARKRSALKQWGNSSSWAGERGGLTELYGCAAPRIKLQFVLVGSLLPVLWLPYLLSPGPMPASPKPATCLAGGGDRPADPAPRWGGRGVRVPGGGDDG